MSIQSESEPLVPIRIKGQDQLGQSARTTSNTIKEAKAVIEKVRDKQSNSDKQKPAK